jgi:hypothetical protein
MATLVTQLKTDINIGRDEFADGMVSGSVADLGHEDAFFHSVPFVLMPIIELSAFSSSNCDAPS